MDSAVRSAVRGEAGQEQADALLARSGDENAACRVEARRLLGLVVDQLDWTDPAALSRAVHDYRWRRELVVEVALASGYFCARCDAGALALHREPCGKPCSVSLAMQLVEEQARARYMGAAWVGARVMEPSWAGPCLTVGTVERQTKKTWTVDGKRLTVKPGRHHVPGSCPSCSGRENYPHGYMD